MKPGFLSIALLIGAPLLFMVIFFVTPIGLILVESFHDKGGALTFDNYRTVLFDFYYWKILFYTLYIAAITCVFCLILAFPLAYYMTIIESSKTVRRLCFALILMPLFTSSIVRSFGWLVLLGRDGLVNETLVALGVVRKPLKILSTQYAIILGMIYLMLPFMVLSIASVLQNISRSLREAARDLGATAWSTFLRVTLPLSIPGIVAGTLIVFTLSISSYVTPKVMSGGRSVVSSMLIYDQYMFVFNPNLGGAITIVLLLTVFCLIGAYTFIMERGRKI
jgi:putative spermidine/putrescine transport system permease protein